MLRLAILAVFCLAVRASTLEKRDIDWEEKRDIDWEEEAVGKRDIDWNQEEEGVAEDETALDFGGLEGAFISEHNKWRSKEGQGLPNVGWDSELAEMAQDNVNQCAMRHDVMGKSTSNYKYIGQNLYMTSLKSLSAQDAAVKSLAAWMSEKKDYNYASNSCAAVCGHYTQVVWKSSTKIGCAVSQGCSGGTFVACNYGPAGNFYGQKPY